MEMKTMFLACLYISTRSHYAVEIHVSIPLWVKENLSSLQLALERHRYYFPGDG